MLVFQSGGITIKYLDFFSQAFIFISRFFSIGSLQDLRFVIFDLGAVGSYRVIKW